MHINWNGDVSDDFSPSGGLRQGDPISPYLFVLCLERLAHCIEDSVAVGTWKPMGFGRDGGPKISHLFFADDILLVSEASHEQLGEAKRILDLFCSVSRVESESSQVCSVFFSS